MGAGNTSNPANQKKLPIPQLENLYLGLMLKKAKAPSVHASGKGLGIK